MLLMRNAIPALCLLLVGTVSGVAPDSRTLEYRDGDTVLEGVLHLPSKPGKCPCVVLAHDQGARSTPARTKAEQLVRLGYVTLSIDLYGKGAAPAPNSGGNQQKERSAREREVFRRRAAAALAALAKVPQADTSRIAAVGYGTGGTAVLDLARAKADLEAVVCVHGDITPLGDEGKNVRCPILVVIGADDPGIPLSQVAAFEEEMRRGGVDWQILRMGGVAGDFTNPKAGRNLSSGRAYDADADQRASEAIRLFLAEAFAPPQRPASTTAQNSAKAPERAKQAIPGVPEKALKVLAHVDQQGQAMEGYEGGRTFGNFERRLRQTDAQGRRIKYREWDVNPLRPGVNRGAERLITGSDGSAYYTDDHYTSFKRIR